jgi:peptide/nickel transport system ATP-binding protein/oligopeptide transport system ATP-binding protein
MSLAAALPGRTAAEAMDEDTLLSVRKLETHFRTRRGLVRAVDDVSFDVRRGGTLAVVGESGSGKSVTSLSIMRLVGQSGGHIAGGSILFRRRGGRIADLAAEREPAMRAIRGNEIAMIFQEPMTSLDPVHSVGGQIAEAVRLHQGVSRGEAFAVAVRMMEHTGIPSPERRAHDYPHQMSGGMRQRVMIAMALSCRPSLLIADEPTTALDVTIQAQILDLIRRLQAEQTMSVLFITHNLGVVAEIAERVIVMYAGRVVEEADVGDLFRSPRHPYTIGLLGSIPRLERSETGGRVEKSRLAAIPGTAPAPLDRPPGCAFAPRCAMAMAACRAAVPPLAVIGPGRKSACIRWRDLAG